MDIDILGQVTVCMRTCSLICLHVCMKVSSVCACVWVCVWCSCVCVHMADVCRCMGALTRVVLLFGLYACPCLHVPGTCTLCDVHISVYTFVWLCMMWGMQIVCMGT